MIVCSILSEDVKHAIKLRHEKDSYTDFYRKLQTLNDRITVYKELFLKRKPNFMQVEYEFSTYHVIV